MEDLFKKFVNAGVGYLAQGSKSVQSTIEKLVKENKMTQAEGKKIVDELMKSGESKRTELEKQFQNIVERAKSSVGLSDAKPPKGNAANSAASKAAGAVKKVADKVSAAAGSAQKSTAAKAAAAKPTAKPAAKAAAKPAAKPAAKSARKPAPAAAAPAAQAEGNA